MTPREETHVMHPGCPAYSSGRVMRPQCREGEPRQTWGSPEMRKQLRFKEAIAARISRAEDQKGES